MKKTGICYTILLFSTLLTNKLMSQGCSDAGVCSIHSIKNNAEGHESKPGSKNNLTFGFGYGKGEQSTNNYTGYAEYTRSITNRTSVTGKLGYSFINGELAKTKGFSDLIISANHSFDINKKWQKSFVAGLKIPFNGSDLEKNGYSLPMPYQTSLGTIDLVLALNYNRKNFGATLAFQQPLKAGNENTFLPGDYPSIPLPGTPPASVFLKYWPTNEFERKADIVGRLSYILKTNGSFSIRPSLLGIYHVANDTYLDDSKNRRPIYNSNGLTLNGIVFFDYRLKTGNGFELALGTPFIVRDQRPDGLTRSFVATLEYQFSF